MIWWRRRGLYATRLRCLDCGREYGLDEVVYTCPHCGGLLDVDYDYDGISKGIDRNDLETRRVHNIWRYAEFLPLDRGHAVSLGEGFTPLIRAGALGRSIGLRNLYLKLDFACPTGSFKDRGSSMMISKAKQIGVDTVAIDSSGNAAASVAGYSARAGLRCYVFAPSYASPAKLVQSLAYGATVFAVEGSRSDTYETARAAYQRFGWYYCGFQTNPYATEGMKTVAYEVCEQLGWSPPDRVVVPVGTGGNLVGCWKGLKELHELGWIPGLPSLVCVQSEGCAPISRAYRCGSSDVPPVEGSRTVAEGLMITHPIKGSLVLRALSETRGEAETVTDEEILHAGRLLASREGVFVEPSAAVSVAGVIKLAGSGSLLGDETVVCLLTGSGLKTKDVYSEIVGRPLAIKPGIGDLEVKVQGRS